MKSSQRIWEIDYIRGTAIILMIAFHTVVDLTDFFSYNISYLSGFWFYIGKLSALLFILTAGISSTLNNKTLLKHGFKVLLCGMILTIITYIYNPSTYIRFGILHLLGCSIMSYTFLSSLRAIWLLMAGMILFVIGYAFTPAIVASPYLLPLGLVTSSFASIDYYPLIPWYGIFLVGAAGGKMLYGKRNSIVPQAFAPSLKLIIYLGKRSLLIYLIHQPILLVILYSIHRK